MDSLGKLIIIIGVGLVILGFIITLASRLGIGRLPGDIYIDKGNFKFFFPITTSIILSLLLSLITKIFRK